MYFIRCFVVCVQLVLVVIVLLLLYWIYFNKQLLNSVLLSVVSTLPVSSHLDCPSSFSYLGISFTGSL